MIGSHFIFYKMYCVCALFCNRLMYSATAFMSVFEQNPRCIQSHLIEQFWVFLLTFSYPVNISSIIASYGTLHIALCYEYSGYSDVLSK